MTLTPFCVTAAILFFHHEDTHIFPHGGKNQNGICMQSPVLLNLWAALTCNAFWLASFLAESRGNLSYVICNSLPNVSMRSTAAMLPPHSWRFLRPGEWTAEWKWWEGGIKLYIFQQLYWSRKYTWIRFFLLMIWYTMMVMVILTALELRFWRGKQLS